MLRVESQALRALRISARFASARGRVFKCARKSSAVSSWVPTKSLSRSAASFLEQRDTPSWIRTPWVRNSDKSAVTMKRLDGWPIFTTSNWYARASWPCSNPLYLTSKSPPFGIVAQARRSLNLKS
jgi:hypothetical protein